MSPSLSELLVEYDTALAFTESLHRGLTDDEILWRPVPESSAIGWHLGHQAAVAHYMVRNLTAAEPPIDHRLDAVMDSATEERQRGDLPGVEQILEYRSSVAERVRYRVSMIDEGRVGAPVQLRRIAETMLTAIVNHEYQHSKWIGEVRHEQHGHALPDAPTSDRLELVEGYLMVG